MIVSPDFAACVVFVLLQQLKKDILEKSDSKSIGNLLLNVMILLQSVIDADPGSDCRFVVEEISRII